MIYLATPYSSVDAEIRQARYEDALAFTARCILAGLPVFSPIVHCHELAIKHQLPSDVAFWNHYCLDMLHGAGQLWVIQFNGWEESKGMKAEIKYAFRNLIPIIYKEATWLP